jgi:tryptophanyl-tRNA synthetase
MFTDPNHLQIEDPGTVEGNVVFTYLDAFCKDEHFAKYLPEYENLDAMKAHYRRGGLGDGTCKKFLLNILEEMLQPMREVRHKYEQDIPGVYEILRKGSEKARAEAAKTLDEVRKAMRIDYFGDAALIEEHTKKYSAK